MIELLRAGSRWAEYTTRCRRKGCAAILMSGDSVIAMEANGPVEGVHCTGQTGNCGCMHAEARLLMRQRHSTGVDGLLVTLNPCPACACLIREYSLITRVYYLYEHRPGERQQGLEILRAANIHVEKLSCSSDPRRHALIAEGLDVLLARARGPASSSSSATSSSSSLACCTHCGDGLTGTAPVPSADLAVSVYEHECSWPPETWR